MTLILKLGLDTIKMYQYTKNEVVIPIASKIIARTDGQIDSMKTLPAPLCNKTGHVVDH